MAAARKNGAKRAWETRRATAVRELTKEVRELNEEMCNMRDRHLENSNRLIREGNDLRAQVDTLKARSAEFREGVANYLMSAHVMFVRDHNLRSELEKSYGR